MTKTTRNQRSQTAEMRLSMWVVEESATSVDQVLRTLNSNKQGLVENDALSRLEKFSKNEVSHEKPPTWYGQLLQSFNLGAVVEKRADVVVQDQVSFLDSPTICFMGTNVISGTAIAVVVATGDRTYFGSLAKNIVGKRVLTSFEQGVNRVSWLLIGFMTVMVPIVFVINGITKGQWFDAFLFGVSIAVGLTPEMLPMIVTANLAKGSVAMANQKVVVKRLNAIQNFGAMYVLCTDKTGTLTQDKIILERHIDLHGYERP